MAQTRRVGKHNERAYLLSAPRFSPYRSPQDHGGRSLRPLPVSPRLLKLTRLGSCRCVSVDQDCTGGSSPPRRRIKLSSGLRLILKNMVVMTIREIISGSKLPTFLGNQRCHSRLQPLSIRYRPARPMKLAILIGSLIWRPFSVVVAPFEWTDLTNLFHKRAIQ
jgi:hypothetical protein